MANLTEIIGGQPFESGTTGNKKNNLLDFWRGTQAQYDALKQTSATTSGNPSSAATVDFTVTSSSIFSVGQTVYVTGSGSGNTTRTTGTVNSIPDATSVVVAFTPVYTSGAATGYQIDLYDPKTIYIIAQMPTNIGHEGISALKVGHENVTAGYIGNQQIFPNSVTIQSAAYTDTSTLSYAGGTRLFRVTGDLGSTYDLTGSGAGSYTLASSPYDHSISIGANTGCSSPAQTITTTLTPTGNTVLQGGGSTFASSFTQGASPNTSQTYNWGISISVSVVTSVTTTYNGVLFFTDGSVFNISYSGNNNSPSTFTAITGVLGSGGISNVTGPLTPGSYSSVSPGAFSGSYTKTFSGNQAPGWGFQRAYLNVNNASATNPCHSVVGGNNGPGGNYSSNIYP